MDAFYDGWVGSGISTQGVLAIITMLGAFVLMGIYVARGQAPDATVVGLIALPLGAVVGFFFGHSNGTTSALAVAATALANRTNPTPSEPTTPVP
jgi:hypothetical protein